MLPEALPRGSPAAAMSFQNFRALQTLDVLLRCIAPAATFAVGVASYDGVHILLLVGLVLHFLATTLRLKPTLFSSRGGGSRSPLLRVYSALVLLAMCIIYVANLHLLSGSVFKPSKYQGVLQILGLWQPRLCDIFSFALLLALASVQSVVAARAATASSLENNQAVVPRINRVPTWRPRWQLLLARKTSTYGAIVLALVLYCIVLLNCDVAFLGVAYLILAVWCLAVQPQKGHWNVLENTFSILETSMLGTSFNSRTIDSRRNEPLLLLVAPPPSSSVPLVDSATLSWIPLLCTTILATLDFVLQLILPAIAANFYISEDILDFLKSAVGIDFAPCSQRDLSLRLLRPVFILACIYIFRKLYSLGILHRQLAHAALTEDEYQQQREAKQRRLAAFFKRVLILHASKIVVFVAFAAAMQDPSALGWVLVLGDVLIPPFVPSNSTFSTFTATRALLIAVYLVSALWLLVQFIIQMPWIRSALDVSIHTQDMLIWLGIVYTTSSTTSLLESLLRWKALLLAAVALNQKVLFWWNKLPDVVLNEAKCGAKCPLFWPPTPTYAYACPVENNSLTLTETSPPPPPAATEENESTAEEEQEEEQETDSGVVQPLNTARVALHSVAQRARYLAQQALTAVDWPASPRPLSTEPTAAAAADTAIAPTEDLKEDQLVAFRFALQDWIERCYNDWGLEIALFTLLVTAFISANALSLVYLAMLAIGMVVPNKLRRKIWMCIVLPVLGMILVWQYSELVGLPPPSSSSSSSNFAGPSASPLAEDVKVWLGLSDVDPHAVWALFIAYGATVLQIYCDRLRIASSSSIASSSAASNNTYRTTTAQEECAVPLLQNSLSTTTTTPTGRIEPESSFFISPYDAQLWAPLKFEAQHQWKFHDWIRYTVYRRSLDILLVAVVALCTLDNDIIHAGYLALALFFFRSRVKLRVRRNSLFAWLPLYNFAVMAIVLAYQAPFEDVWDWPLDDGTSCTLAHLLGLYKLHPSSSPSPPSSKGSLLSWGYEGSLADLILWVFIRFQSHLFESQTYRQVVAVAEAEESQERAARKAEVAEWKQSQAAAAIEESGQRAARALRISRIKQGVDRNLNLLFGGSKGGQKTNEEETGSHLDFDFLDIGSGKDHIFDEKSSSSNSTTSLRQRQQKTAAAAPRPSVAMLTEYERTMARISEIEAESHVMEGTTTEEQAPPSYLETEEQHRVVQQKENENQEKLPSGNAYQLTYQSRASLSWIGPALNWCNEFLPRRADRRESALAYTLFAFAYLSDLSLLTLVLPLSAFVYSLVAVRPARAYWHGVLIYCEAIIVSSYAFQVPSRLDCGFLSPQLQRTAEMMGIHSNAARCIPLFFVYLATLRHTHGLITRHAAGERQRAAAAAEQPPPGATTREIATGFGSQLDLERGTYDADNEEVVEIVEDFEAEQEEGNGSALQRSPSGNGSSVAEVYWITYSVEYISKAAAALCEFILTACAAQCERSPSFLLVELQKGKDDARTSTGTDIEKTLQGILDRQRTHDISSSSGSSSCSLAAMGPIKLRFHSFLDESVLPPKSALSQSSSQEEEADATSTTTPMNTINALFEVIPLQCTPQNTPGVCSVPGWPLRSLRPAATAASVLVGSSSSASEEIAGSSFKVVAAEPHGRQARDFYALTAVLDILAFIFVAVYYNKVVQAAGSLSEITSQHVVPLGYLLTLITLFMFIVMDRVVYTLGNAAGKVALHLAEMALFFWYCSSLVWDPPDYDSSVSSAARVDAYGIPRDFHLRILLALKSASFALSALQLRTGYPPPASYANGMGRHTFVFMRSVSWPASLAFHAFTAVPFLYEMRQLLDWASTPTTLTLYDWLKLEDINMSLYFAAVMRASRAAKPHGLRQPRYLKFFSGTLLFSLLLVLLWVPLLVFSTGNPTYQVPSLATFSVNVTLQASSAEQGLKLSSPLYRGGDRGVSQQWIQSSGTEDPTSVLPPALAVDYSPKQLQLLCTPADADSLWTVSPPARQALTFVLESQDADVAISFGWNVQRDLPPVSEHGGPTCSGTAVVPLVEESQRALLAVLKGDVSSAPLVSRNSKDDSNSTSALFPAFWLMRGDACVARPLQQEDIRGGAGEALPNRKRRAPIDVEWADRWVACNASLETTNTAEIPTTGEVWWKLECSIVDSQGNHIPDEQENTFENKESSSTAWPIACPSSSSALSSSSSATKYTGYSKLFTGPRIVVLLDRVQGGIIGATISKFGVVGLYTVFVYGIGRFLRLSVTNLRMRIPFEDLPTTRRLVILCQDIYIARAEGLLGLEEELYGALITVYRLPNLLFALTKKNK